jgi:hypothetical protein
MRIYGNTRRQVDLLKASTDSNMPHASCHHALARLLGVHGPMHALKTPLSLTPLSLTPLARVYQLLVNRVLSVA